MKILIIGSSSLLSEISKIKEFHNACIELGKAIAQRGHKLIICSANTNTADYSVLKGYSIEKKNSEVIVYRPSRDSIKTDPDTDFSALQQDLDISPMNYRIITVFGGWRSVHLKAIKMADVVIALGGTQRGLGQVVRFSEIEGKAIVVIPSFGCAAEEIWVDIKHYYDQETQTLLEQKSATVNWGKEIISIAEKYYRKNPFNETRVLNLLAKLITAGFLVCVWFYLLFSPNPFINYELIFILMLIVSSILGSILRDALIGQNILSSDWGQKNILTNCLIGIVLIIPVFCIPQLFGYMLNDQFASITSLSQARRIGFALSIFSFIASIFQEEAFEKSFEFLKKIVG